MIIDVIIESIIYVSKGDGIKMNKEEWIEYLDEKIPDFDGDYIKWAKQAVQEEDWREFKLRMNEYMWKNNYGASWTYNQFNRLSFKKISECIK
jgi:hypothetical protein